MKLISIIIPVYNAEKWLNDCIESVINAAKNKFNQLEIILVNDGSTDDSCKICDTYAEKYENILVAHKENGGVSSARNVGLSKANGQYIAWIDPDDYISEKWFDLISDTIHQFAPDVILMDSLKLYVDGKTTAEVYGRTAGKIEYDTFYDDIIRDHRVLSGLPNKVFKAQLFNGISFDTSLSIMEDYDVLPKVLNKGKSAYYIAHPLYIYRQHDDSLIHSSNKKNAFKAVEIAYKRLVNITDKYKSAAISAVALQAFHFYRSAYAYKDFTAQKSELIFCKKFIRKNLSKLIKDSELPFALRTKMFLTALGVFRFLVKINNR